MKKDSIFTYFTKNRESLSQQQFKEGTSFKSYGRFPKITFPEPEPINETLSDLVLKRHSLRDYTNKALTLQALSTFLFWSVGIIVPQDNEYTINERRTHPSGGGKFPIELYLLILKDGEVSRGVYHYCVKTHTLEKLVTVDISEVLAQLATHDMFAIDSGVIILFSFVKNRSLEKYGALAYKLAFMESGHISQNMYLVAAALNLACCGLGISDASGYNRTLQLKEYEESIFYGIVIGVPK